MKRQVRYGVFETNSSSVHALCIYKEQPKYIPNFVTVRPDKFGWEEAEYHHMETKLSYVYEMCKYADEEWEYHLKKKAAGEEVFGPNLSEANHVEYGQVKKLLGILESWGIHVDFTSKMDTCYSPTGYIDHGDDWIGQLNDFLNDEDQLKRFLFCDESMVQTGNDNDESCIGVGNVPGSQGDKYIILYK